jgi:hypothetical protein
VAGVQSEALGGLPERQQHLAQATDLWLAGHSKREACRQAGVPRTTLSDALDRAGLTESDRAKYTDIVEDLAIRAAEEAGRQLLERLEGDAALPPMQLVTPCEHALHEVGGRVGHAPAPAGRGGSSGPCTRRRRCGAAVVAVHAHEAVGEDAAVEKAAELAHDEARHRPLACLSGRGRAAW